MLNSILSSDEDRLLTTAQTAGFLGVSMAFLERDRWCGPRIRFVRVGHRAVRYRLSDLRAYIGEHINHSPLKSET